MCAVALAPPRLSQTTQPERSERAAARALEQALLVRYHRAGDLAAREELVERFLPFARDLARRYSYTDESFDDLVQVASVGLIKAIDRFDPDRGAKFTSFAAPTILGELKRHFRDKGWALHVPRDLQERTLAVTRETEALSKRLGRSPKVARGGELARLLGRSRARGTGGLGELRGRVARRPDLARGRRGRTAGRPARRRGRRPTSSSTDRDAIASTWKALPDVERKVLELRFMHDLNQREIGERIGYSQMHVSRLLRRALHRLETAATAA